MNENKKIDWDSTLTEMKTDAYVAVMSFLEICSIAVFVLLFTLPTIAILQWGLVGVLAWLPFLILVVWMIVSRLR